MEIRSKWKLLRFFFTNLFLFAVWVLFTADLSAFSLLAGILGSLLISALTYDIFLSEHQANLRFFLPSFWGLFKFLLFMFLELYKSSFQVLVAVITGKTNPRIVHFRTRLRSDLARATLSNAITFTPGTLTLDLNDDHLTVHWLFCNTTHTKAAGIAIKEKMEKQLGHVWL
ncbi:MAG: Na+/H+ antiporter subunit E [Sphaerochaeta sp.]|nr:Na+/H+ antiporter subunit E [Sphaerochaeta sp.]